MTWYNAPNSSSTGNGITSISITGNSPLLITNSPLTSSGTIGITLGAASASSHGYLTSGDYATFAAAAAPSGTVILQKPNGTYQYFTSASDTSTARGTTLLSAVAAAAAGDTIRLGAGAYSTALSGITLNDVDIVGLQQDITSISSTNDTATLNLVNCYISNISITNVSTNGRAIQSSGTNIDSCALTASSASTQIALDCYNTTNLRNSTVNGRINVRTNGSMYMSDVRVVSPQTIGIYFYAGTTSTLHNVDVTSSAERALAGDNVTSVYAYDSTFVGALNGTLLINTAGTTNFYNCQILCTNSTYYPIVANPVARVIELHNTVVSGAGSKAIDNTNLCTIRANHTTSIYGAVLGTITRIAPPHQLMPVPSSLLLSNANIPSHTGTATISGSIGAGGLVYNSSTNTPAYYNGASWQNLYPYGYGLGTFFLPQALQIGFNSGNVGTGITDIYTVPTGYRMAIDNARVYNLNATSVLKIHATVSGQRYPIGHLEPLSNTYFNGFGPVFEPGTVIGIQGVGLLGASPTGTNVSMNLVRFPTGVALKTAWKYNIASGSNTVYTCPANTVARLVAQGTYPAVDCGLRLINGSTGASLTANIYLVPSGGAIGLNSFIGSITALPATSGDFDDVPIGGMLTPGMTVVLNVTTNATGVAALTLQEYPSS